MKLSEALKTNCLFFLPILVASPCKNLLRDPPNQQRKQYSFGLFPCIIDQMENILVSNTNCMSKNSFQEQTI